MPSKRRYTSEARARELNKLPPQPETTEGEYVEVEPGPAALICDQAHAENWGGKHRQGFCEACADAHIVAQHALSKLTEEEQNVDALRDWLEGKLTEAERRAEAAQRRRAEAAERREAKALELLGRSERMGDCLREGIREKAEWMRSNSPDVTGDDCAKALAELLGIPTSDQILSHLEGAEPGENE